MNEKKFSDAMDELDTKYVDEALSYNKESKKRGWIKWGVVAAGREFHWNYLYRNIPV